MVQGGLWGFVVVYLNCKFMQELVCIKIHPDLPGKFPPHGNSCIQPGIKVSITSGLFMPWSYYSLPLTTTHIPCTWQTIAQGITFLKKAFATHGEPGENPFPTVRGWGSNVGKKVEFSQKMSHILYYIPGMKMETCRWPSKWCSA